MVFAQCRSASGFVAPKRCMVGANAPAAVPNWCATLRCNGLLPAQCLGIELGSFGVKAAQTVTDTLNSRFAREQFVNRQPSELMGKDQPMRGLMQIVVRHL